MNPPGTSLLGWIVLPPSLSQMSLDSFFMRRAIFTTSGWLFASGTTDGTPSRSGAARK